MHVLWGGVSPRRSSTSRSSWRREGRAHALPAKRRNRTAPPSPRSATSSRDAFICSPSTNPKRRQAPRRGPRLWSRLKRRCAVPSIPRKTNASSSTLPTQWSTCPTPPTGLDAASPGNADCVPRALARARARASDAHRFSQRCVARMCRTSASPSIRRVHFDMHAAPTAGVTSWKCWRLVRVRAPASSRSARARIPACRRLLSPVTHVNLITSQCNVWKCQRPRAHARVGTPPPSDTYTRRSACRPGRTTSCTATVHVQFMGWNSVQLPQCLMSEGASGL